jgi:hypothetical protein
VIDVDSVGKIVAADLSDAGGSTDFALARKTAR